MRGIVVREWQNIIDVCIQEYGSIERLVKLCVDNGLALDDELEAGQVILIDDSAIARKGIVEYFRKKGIKVCTGEPEEDTDGIHTEDGFNILTEDGEHIALE